MSPMWFKKVKPMITSKEQSDFFQSKKTMKPMWFKK